MKTAIMWFRNDLRIHDLPALVAAAEADRIVPVFILDDKQLKAKNASSNRNRFLLECLEDLKRSLRKLGADLVMRHGKAETILQELAKETNATEVHYTIDYTPYSIERDQRITKALHDANLNVYGHPGRLAIDSLKGIETNAGTVIKVFTPFWKKWMDVKRRDVVSPPSKLQLPSTIQIGLLPTLDDIKTDSPLSKHALQGGETEGRKRLKDWLENGIENYKANHQNMSVDATSRLSSYMHFGCLSIREIEPMLPNNEGGRSWHRQLAWRDFYNYVLLNYPKNIDTEFQERYRKLSWSSSKKALLAWTNGQTGYPIVDAAMRQLAQEGWMHNRGRLIVGCFLTKDLHLDWREGQDHFMRMLIDGDNANNNGNWQWISSVGVDPAPMFRRLYNPMSQHEKFDPDNTYVRKYVPELAKVPDTYIREPWNMPEDEQQRAGCIIGRDYPEPIVDHKEERLVALERYRQAVAEAT